MNKLSYLWNVFLFFATFVETNTLFIFLCYSSIEVRNMESYNHINTMFDEMIDDIKYIKIATFVKCFQR